MVKVMSGAQMRQLHATMDTDADSLVSLDEAFTFVKVLRTSLEAQSSFRIMEIMDANKDGRLSQQEYAKDLRNLNIPDERKLHGNVLDEVDAVLSHEEVLPLFNFMFSFQNLDVNKE